MPFANCHVPVPICWLRLDKPSRGGGSPLLGSAGRLATYAMLATMYVPFVQGGSVQRTSSVSGTDLDEEDQHPLPFSILAVSPPPLLALTVLHAHWLKCQLAL